MRQNIGYLLIVLALALLPWALRIRKKLTPRSDAHARQISKAVNSELDRRDAEFRAMAQRMKFN